MQLSLSIYRNLFLKLFLLSFPFQVQVLIYKTSFFNGQFNYFTSFFVYLGELFLILSLFFFYLDKFINGIKQEEKMSEKGGDLLERGFWIVMLLLISWCFLTVFWSAEPAFSLLLAFRQLELFGLFHLLISVPIARKELFIYLIVGIIFQFLIGLGQYIKQGGLSLSFLGESLLNLKDLNVAKVEIDGEKILRAYGTFLHPNVYGTFFLVNGFSLWFYGKNFRNRLWFKLLFVMIFVAMIISFSRAVWLSAFLGLAVVLVIQLKRVKYLKLFMFLAVAFLIAIIFGLDRVMLARIGNIMDSAFWERVDFMKMAWGMFINHPLQGVGLGGFVFNMAEYSTVNLASWLFQPVHNVPLLLLAELGSVGGSLLTILAILIGLMVNRTNSIDKTMWGPKTVVFIAVFLPLFLLDHLFYTSWEILVSLMVLLSLIFTEYHESRSSKLLS